MAMYEVFTVLEGIQEDIDSIVQLTFEISAGTFDDRNYAETLANLSKAGRKLKGINNEAGQLIGVKLLELTKEITRYNNTAKSRKRITKVLKKFDSAIRNEALYKKEVR